MLDVHTDPLVASKSFGATLGSFQEPSKTLDLCTRNESRDHDNLRALENHPKTVSWETNIQFDI